MWWKKWHGNQSECFHYHPCALSHPSQLNMIYRRHGGCCDESPEVPHPAGWSTRRGWRTVHPTLHYSIEIYEPMWVSRFFGFSIEMRYMNMTYGYLRSVRARLTTPCGFLHVICDLEKFVDFWPSWKTYWKLEISTIARSPRAFESSKANTPHSHHRNHHHHQCTLSESTFRMCM